MVLLASLVVATTYWQTWARPALADRQDNAIQRVVEFTVKRGDISSPRRACSRATGAVKKDGRTLYFRRYPHGPLTAHVVGYSTVGAVARRARALAERLPDRRRRAASSQLVETLARQAQGEDRCRATTSACRSTSSPSRWRASSSAAAAAPSRRSTRGRGACSSSTRRRATTRTASRTNFGSISNDHRRLPRPRRRSSTAAAGASTRRARSSRWSPPRRRSTRGRDARRRRFYDPGYCIAYGKRVNNFDTSSPFGTINLFDALVHSVNSVFCNIGQELGAKRILAHGQAVRLLRAAAARDAGRPSAARAGSTRTASYSTRSATPTSTPAGWPSGRSGCSSRRCRWRWCAGTIGNGGILMEPHVVDRIVVARRESRRPRQARRSSAARHAGDGPRTWATMMVAAVQRGTGTRRTDLRAYASAARRERPRRASRASTTRGSSPTPACRARSRGSRSPSSSRTSRTDGRPRLGADRRGP